ncbi:hypothetical protein [Phosphitispora fastidiosa]|uniref:hypothetical protein n=1 Tax=Phosphitispora fastidiosa TaxID=2837202 RepID=UPI001E54BA21|nr:hypothetical protein [Phosphitispora fastidiosa]MBU7005252.1 hypothetical protein [Phosphitispora fastidiosa]
MEEEIVIQKLKIDAQGIANAWYALHVLNTDKIGQLNPYLRSRFGIDRQLCYNLIHIICRYLENNDVGNEIQEWINSSLSVGQLETVSDELVSLRINFLMEVIDNELNSLRENGKVSEPIIWQCRGKITGVLEYVKKEYVEALLKL